MQRTELTWGQGRSVWSALTLLVVSWTFPISAQSVSYAGSAQVLRDYEAKLSTSDVDALELRVKNNADDLKSREILIAYYTLKQSSPNAWNTLFG